MSGWSLGDVTAKSTKSVLFVNLVPLLTLNRFIVVAEIKATHNLVTTE